MLNIKSDDQQKIKTIMSWFYDEIELKFRKTENCDKLRVKFENQNKPSFVFITLKFLSSYML